MSNSKEHLHSVEESYFEHMGHALSYSTRLLKAAAACLIHAIVPAYCTNTASKTIRTMHEEITHRQNRSA